MPTNMLRSVVDGLARASLLGALCLTAGCNLIAAPFLMWAPEPTKEVPAQWPHLHDKSVCILVWADADTLIEHSWVQLEIAEHVEKSLEPNVEGITFIPNRKVYDLMRREPNWDRTDPAVLGERFGAERVLMIELTQFTTREPESPHLYRGHISGNVKIYNVEYPGSAPVFKTLVESVYPPESAGQWGTNDREIRKAAMEAFASEVASRFYDRRVKVR